MGLIDTPGGKIVSLGVLVVVPVVSLFVWSMLHEFGVLGASPERVVSVSLDRTYEQFENPDLGGGQSSSGSSETEVRIASRQYNVARLHWSEGRDHPESFDLLPAGFRRPDPSACVRLSRALPGGLDATEHWEWKGLKISCFQSIEATVSPRENPNWKKRLDVVWKVIFGAVFEIPVSVTAAEMAAALGGVPVGDQHVGHP